MEKKELKELLSEEEIKALNEEEIEELLLAWQYIETEGRSGCKAY